MAQVIKNKQTDSSQDSIVVTTNRKGFLDWFGLWKHRPTPWPFPFGRGCCSLEFLDAFSPASIPLQVHGKIPCFPVDVSNVMFIGGGINHKSLGQLLDLHKKMPRPHWIVAVGVCGPGNGLFKMGQSLVKLEDYLDIDIFIPGCPPTQAAIWEGLYQVKQLMEKSK